MGFVDGVIEEVKKDLNRIVDLARRASKNNTVVNVGLAASFVLLAAKSWDHQKDIEVLEAEKESLLKSNKAIRKTMWDWKQQLYAEASNDDASVPLARLKAIYGEVPPPQQSLPGNTGKQDANSSVPTKIIV